MFSFLFCFMLCWTFTVGEPRALVLAARVSWTRHSIQRTMSLVIFFENQLDARQRHSPLPVIPTKLDQMSRTVCTELHCRLSHTSPSTKKHNGNTMSTKYKHKMKMACYHRQMVATFSVCSGRTSSPSNFAIGVLQSISLGRLSISSSTSF